MSQAVFGLTFTLFTALIVIVGDYVIKLAADGGQPMLSRLVLLGCGLYALSALLWFAAMHHVTLAQAGVAYSMFTLLALVAIGALAFNEPVRFREATGVLCALAAMWLIMRVD